MTICPSWLRSCPAKAICFACAGSNPAVVEIHCRHQILFAMKDRLAKWLNAIDSSSIPLVRGFESHTCQFRMEIENR